MTAAAERMTPAAAVWKWKLMVLKVRAADSPVDNDRSAGSQVLFRVKCDTTEAVIKDHLSS